jgi:tetratricopeptide (TPR) repeat protein
MKSLYLWRAGLSLLVAALVLFSAVALADDFEGAGALLQKLNEAQAPSPTPAQAPTLDTVGQFAKDLDSFTKQANGQAPADAARNWLALFDRAEKLQAARGEIGGFGSVPRAVFSALPGPSAWPALESQIKSRAPDAPGIASTPAALRLIADTLMNAEDQQWADLAKLSAVQASSSTPRFTRSGDSFLSMGSALSEVSNQPGQVEKFWNQALDKIGQASAPVTGSDGNELELPDLVTILGKDKAQPIVLRALLVPTPAFSKFNGIQTQVLARELALADIDKLHVPPWFLTQSLEGAGLYEALRKKFPNDDGGDESKIYYVVALVTHGRAEEAAKADHDLDLSQIEGATEQLAEAGWQPQVYDYVHAYLVRHPDSDLWKFYIDLAGQTGHASDALKFVQDTNARADLSDGARARVRAVLYRGLLAVDRVDEGIAELRTLIKAEENAPPTTPSSFATILNNTTPQASMRRFMAQRQAMEDDPTEKIVRWDIELAQLGSLLKRPDLETEGFDDAVKRVESLPAPNSSNPGMSVSTEARKQVWTFEMETGRYAPAEKLVIDQIVQIHQASANSPTLLGRLSGMTGYTANDYETRELLTELALVYYEAGRWPDIVTLLEKAPEWGVRDQAYLPRRPVPHLDLMAARALAETGRTAEALPILDYTLQEDSGNDAAYALLLKTGQGDLVSKLDALYRQDQFQERPLIWKAVVLLRQGHAAEAGEACKAAIAVDPSDGEEGKGDRMRVYSVMADVDDAEKQPQQATFFRNAVKAIRLSEDADDYYDAGLLTRAVAMYGQALDLFSGAYCIQSRIARQLAELGRMDEAAVHYRKAFELMPVSFGRLESHCFGCERAFEGKTAAGIAEETFTQMMAKDPTKPQLPYLLGYLYMEEKRFPEALANFEKAVQLDPDYINAWRHIAEIGEDYQLSPELRDNAVFNLLRLDPAGRHVTPKTDEVRQLDKLWSVEAIANEAIPPVPETLFALTASAARVKPGMDPLSPHFTPTYPGMTTEMQSWLQLQQIAIRVGRDFYHGKGEGVSPREAVLGNKIISVALDLL